MKSDSRKAVSRVVQEILEHGRQSRADGPSSGLYGRDAQLASALSKAGLMLAKFDRGGAAGRRPSVLQNVLNVIGAQAKPKSKRSWFFASAVQTDMPNAKRIEQLLQAAQRDGEGLVFDRLDKAHTSNEDMACHLPEGATDPVCEPRR
jgi:hypothetical protein